MLEYSSNNDSLYYYMEWELLMLGGFEKNV